MANSTADGVLQAIGLTIASIIIGLVAYFCLSVPFLRSFAIGALILAAIIPTLFAIFIITLGVAAVNNRIERKERLSRATVSSEYSKRLIEIDPDIAVRLDAVSKIKVIVGKHLETLARRRLMLVTVDHYGIADGSAWNKEVQRFIDKVVRPELSEQEAQLIAPSMNSIFQEMIEDRVRLRSDEIEADIAFPQNITPIQFEQWCARILISKGWKAITTKASGDQGADVVAEKEGMRVILQCKLYSGSVGNSAVQEAFAAQRHYSTGASAVVSNAEFSASAKALAVTTGVLLLHYSELTRLDALLASKLGLPHSAA